MLGELDGVADQVGQHLAQAQRVAAQARRQARVQRVDHLQPLFLGAQRGGGRDGLQHVVQCEVHLLQHQHAGLYLGEVEDVVDHGQQRVGRALHLLQIAALARGQRRLLHQTRHADDGVHGRADLVAHGGQKVGLGAFGRFGGFLGLPQRLLGFALAGDVQHDAVPDHALVAAPGRRAAAQPADFSIGPEHAEAAVEHAQRIDRVLHHLLVERQVRGVDGIQVDLAVGHDGAGRHADQVLDAGTDIAEPQVVQAAFEAVDGAAGQVVGQGFQPGAGILVLGKVLQRAAQGDDAPLFVPVGTAQDAGREPPAVGTPMDHIDAVGLAGRCTQMHGSGEPGQVLGAEHVAHGLACQRRALGVQSVHHIHHLRGLEALGLQIQRPAAYAGQLLGLAQNVIAFLQLGLGLAYLRDVARNAQQAHGVAPGIPVGALDGLEDAVLSADLQMLVRYHGDVAVQHPAIAVAEVAPVLKELLVGFPHDVFGRALGKARRRGVDEDIPALQVLDEYQVGRLAHDGRQQARRVLPQLHALLDTLLQLRVELVDLFVMAHTFADVVQGGEEQPPSRWRLAVDMDLGRETAAVAAQQSAGDAGLAVHGHVLPQRGQGLSGHVQADVRQAQPKQCRLVVAQAGAGLDVGVKQAALVVKQEKTVGHTVQELAIRRIGHEDS